jgi:small subunit ribosomal protein S15
MLKNKVNKKEIVQKHRNHATDSGSPEVQVALLSSKIDYLTQHLGQHVKDHSTRRGLLRMVSRRRSLLDYLKQVDMARYQKLIVDLGLRK